MADYPDIKLAIGLKPEQIIDWYRNKGYKISWNWKDTWEEAHIKAFTVSKAMKLDILSDIRNELQRSMEEGLSFQQFKENLKPVLKAKGWWGKVKAKDVPSDFPLPPNIDPGKEVLLGSPWRLRTIYRTNMSVAYQAGHYKSMVNNIKNRPYWMYNAILDSNTRPSHRALHGKVFRADDPIWDKIYPPNDWNCRCSVIPLDDDDLKEMNLKVSRGNNELINELNPGEGWDYNPGKAFLEFDNNFGQFNQIKEQKTFKDYNSLPIEDIPDEYFSDMDELYPPLNKIGEERFINLIKREFRLDNNNFSIINTADDDKAIITLDRLKHIWQKRDGREQFIKLLKPTLQSPYEVYLSLYKSDKNFVEYRKIYIGLYKDKKKRPFFVVLRMEKDSTIFWNAFPQKPRDLDKIRRGILIYKK